MPTVQIKLGNLFDEPTDLIVLPCNVYGGVTQFVSAALRSYALPEPPSIPLGEISIVPMVGAENVAQYAAYAASVLDGTRTTESVLESIGKSIGMFCKNHIEVSRVSAPLLGAGAGGLQSEKAVSGMKEGFISAAPPGTSLTIFVLHKNVYDRIQTYIKALRATDSPSTEKRYKRVFISYTGSGPQHIDLVVEIATKLRQHGIDARLDRWHLRHGMELPQWMTNELEMADKVLIISDELYREKADGQVGGVGWETRIIQGDILDLPPENTKYLVVVCGPDFTQSIPRYLKAKFAIHWPPTANKKEKLDEILLAINETYSPPPINEVFTI